MTRTAPSRPGSRPLAALLVALAAALASPLSALAAGSACVNVVAGEGIGGTGSPARDGGIGGTGAPAISGGIGGTGTPARTDGGGGIGGIGGIGGTGMPMAAEGGGTGIVGVITGFASICVNGLEVHYDAGTPVNVNGRAAHAAALAIGQMVAVEAHPGPQGLTARSIGIVHALEGPVGQPIPQGQAMRGLRVMGQPVVVTADTVGSAMGQRLAAGEQVLVSGHRNSHGAVVATRIDRAPALAEQSVVGIVNRVGPVQDIHGTRISGSTPAAERGTEVLVRGRWDGERLHAAETFRNPTTPFDGRVGRIVVESLLHETRSSGEMQVGKFRVSMTSATRYEGDRAQLREDQRVRITGRVEGANRIVAERIQIDRPEGGSRDPSPASDGDGRRAADRHRGEDRSGSSGRGERIEIDRSGSSGSGDRVERMEKIERPETTQKIEKPERIDRIDKSGRHSRLTPVLQVASMTQALTPNH